MQRIIAEEEPERPSTRVSTLLVGGDVRILTSHSPITPTTPEKDTASSRRLPPGKELIAMLRGDLDWIVLKCLEKDRRRRYDTPNELAADLKRHLHNEPVFAAAPTFRYQLQKLYARNRPAVATAGAFAALLLIAAIISTALAIRATRAEKAGATEAAKAREQAAIAEAVNKFLNEDLLGQADPDNSSDKDIKVREVLDRAAGKIEGRFKDQPNVEAAIRETIGTAYKNIGLWELAETHLEATLKFLSQDERAFCEQNIRIMIDLSQLYQKRNTKRAEEIARQAFNLAQKYLHVTNFIHLRVVHSLGAILDLEGKPEGIQLLQKALTLRRQTLGFYDRDTLASVSAFGKSLWRSGRYKEYEDLIISDHLHHPGWRSHPRSQELTFLQPQNRSGRHLYGSETLR